MNAGALVFVEAMISIVRIVMSMNTPTGMPLGISANGTANIVRGSQAKG